jgi:hypothetical protein
MHDECNCVKIKKTADAESIFDWVQYIDVVFDTQI